MEKKIYIQPTVEQTQLMPNSMILAGSGSGLGIGGSPIPGSGGD